MVGLARVAIAGCGLLALVACSGDGETTTPSTTAPPSSTTVAPSTTSAPTTTLSPQQQDEAEIRDLHDRFFRMIVLTGASADPQHPQIAATTTGIQRQRWEEGLERRRQLGQLFGGDFRSTLMSVRFDDADNAGILDCTTDASTILTPDATVIEQAGGDSIVTELRVTRTSSGWRVADWFTGGTDPCDA